MNKTISFVIIILVPIYAFGQNGNVETRSEIPIRFFTNFIGTYEVPDSLLKKYPKMADRPMVTIEFDMKKRSVHLIEAHTPNNKGNRTLEGLALWNPLTDRVEFYGYNSDSDFLFKGEYTILKNDLIQRIYDVYYPSGHEFYKNGHAILTFRETMTLSIDAKLLQNKVEYFDKKTDNWLAWSTSTLIRVN